MIKADNLSLSFAGAPLFKGLSFTIQKGERIALLGRNGSGKSTLLRILTGEITPDSGELSFPAQYRIGFLDQHIRFTKETLKEEALLGLPPRERHEEWRIEKILCGLGFKKEDLGRPLGEFSGGYHLRLHLAKVFASEPDCLLLDEPTNYLDIVSTRWLSRFLKRWPGELIIISHDREFLDSLTTHTMGLHRQELCKVKGGTAEYFEKILQEEELHEKTRAKLEKKRAHLESYVKRFGAKASKAVQARSRKKAIERMPSLEKLKDLYNLQFHFNEAPFRSKKVLSANHMTFSFNPQEELVKNFSLEIESGDRIAIIGKNGRGKSTLLRLLSQELTPQKGEVSLNENVKLGYFGQTNIDRLNKTHSVEEEIKSANKELANTEVKGLCGLMMFSGDESQKKIAHLSGGERSRVLLGKILAEPCNLLFLDEPTHHLDIESVEALIDALEEFSQTLVIVTHSELILNRLNLNKIVICHQSGQQHFLGDYEEFLEKVGWPDEEEKPKKPKKTALDRKAYLTRIGELEKSIIALEERLEKKLTKLNETSEASEAQKLYESVGELSKELEKLYDEYGKLGTER